MLIGLLMIRNEPDVARAALEHHAAHADALVVQDGSDSPELWMRDHPAVAVYLRDADVLQPGERWTDGHRAHALNAITQRFGRDGVWVSLCHADEFWLDNPRSAASAAASEGATFVLWAEFRFYLRASARQFFDPSLDPRDSVRDWAGPYFEVRQFSLAHHHSYLPGRDHCTLPAPGRGVQARVIPRYRHYPYRTPEQCARAHADKVASRYWQPDHAWLARSDGWRSGPPEPSNSPRAWWRQTGVFDGSLPDPIDCWNHPPRHKPQ